MNAATLTPPRLSALSPAQVDGYHETGYVIARNVFAPREIEALRNEAERLFQRADLMDSDNIRCRWLQDRYAEYGKVNTSFR